MKHEIKRAMQANLSCLHVSSASRNAIMDKVREGKNVKRKISAGLILAIALMLIAIGALAAVILTNKEFISQVLSPIASGNTSETWSREEMNQILNTAKAYGITLDEDTIKKLSSQDTNYKGEIMRLFAKAELGFYPSTWSIEDQAWFDQMLVDSRLNAHRTRFVPEGDEITQQKALDIAHEYIRKNYDANATVTEPALYRRHMIYKSFFDNPYSKGKEWDIEFEPLDQLHSYYIVVLLSDGTVKYAQRDLGPMEDGRIPTLAEVQDMYVATYGVFDSWTMETWISFRDALHKSADLYGYDSHSKIGNILEQQYAMPDSKAIPVEEAFSIARKAISEAGGPNEIALNDKGKHKAYALYLKSANGPVWKVSYFCQTYDCSIASHMAEIDAFTGTVLNLGTRKRTDPWIIPYVLFSTLQKVSAPSPTFTPRIDGKPRIWYSNLAPAYYWKALDDLAYNKESASDLMDRWHMEYGDDNMFWPLKERAIDIIWHELGQDASVLPGLPAPEDMQQESALETAWQAFIYECGDLYDGETMANLKTAVSFTFNTPVMGDRVWHVQFVKFNPAAYVLIASVSINAKTGAIIECSWKEVDPSPTPTLRPDGMPSVYHSNLIPGYFWDALDEAIPSGKTLTEIEVLYEREYGTDRNFWPLLAKAVIGLWDFTPGFSTTLFGLPAPEDIQQEEALALAKNALAVTYGDTLGESYISNLQPVVAFHFLISTDNCDRVWFIQFVEKTLDEDVFCADATIDATTGDILSVNAGRSHG